jgi:1,4-alpha-glucan branching enzyme
LERIPAWITRVERRPPNVHFDGVFWDPPVTGRHVWKHARPGPKPAHETLRIYECHVGMCSEEAKVASYEEFRVNVLPRVHALGYNALQLMAVMEHPYYGSFGYQVTSFFAASSRFGTPEELQHLIDDAHGLGMRVLLDLVHSHASSNALDGINEYDGTDHCFFHAGDRGKHPQWDSRLFNYGHWEVLRFLLSNVSYWIKEFHFDGFRYDGVTSMLYLHHGIGNSFAGGYADYFSQTQADTDAIVYLCLANDLCHSLGALTIAEDVSGYPGIARPVAEGGLGFDYRLHMAVADKWIELLKHERDEDWSMGGLVHTCTNRRYQEGHIAYSESHDQSLVGDKTLMMWLADREIYTHMSVLSPLSVAIDRAVALHKMIVSISWALGGEGLLNFCGNEFGHPEWVDFPREGNGESYHYARRQWSLAKDPLLRYHFLEAWNKEILSLEEQYHFCGRGREYTVVIDEGAKVIAAERPVGQLLWIWNFHSTRSHEGFHIPCHSRGAGWRVLTSSDAKRFGGHDRVAQDQQYEECPTIYLPNRTCIVLKRVSESQKSE